MERERERVQLMCMRVQSVIIIRESGSERYKECGALARETCDAVIDRVQRFYYRVVVVQVKADVNTFSCRPRVSL